MKYVNCTYRVRTNVLFDKMREHRAVLYTADGCVTQTRLRVCLVHNSTVFANQQGMYACVNVISIFHGKGPLAQFQADYQSWLTVEVSQFTVNANSYIFYKQIQVLLMRTFVPFS